MERKTFQTYAIKVDEAQGIVEHIVAVMGNVDEVKDIIHNGAFVKTISERGTKVRVLDAHNTDSIMRVLGKPRSMREIGKHELPADLLMKYPDATGGLQVETQYLMNTPEGKGAFERIQSGAVDEYSIGYDPLDFDYSKVLHEGKEIIVRNLRTIKLYEYSPVLWAANPATTTLSAKEKPSEGKPWNVFEEDGKWRVYRLDEDGKPTGEPLGEHDSEEGARQQIEALYANEGKDEKATTQAEDMPMPDEGEKAMDEDHMAQMEKLRVAMRSMMDMMEEMMGNKKSSQNIKAGRRVRSEKLELLRQLQDITHQLMSWAQYEDEDEHEEEMAAPKKAADKNMQAGAGPASELVRQPPTQEDLLKLIELEQSELTLLEI